MSWTRDDFISEQDHARGEAGFPFSAFSNALQMWAFMQAGPRVSLAAAAQAFNVAPSLVAEAVRDHCWMYLETESGALLDHRDFDTGDASETAIDDYARVFIGHEGA